MFPSFSLRLPFRRSPPTNTHSSAPITLPPVPIHDTSPSDPHQPPAKRRLKQLLKLNHVNHAILFHHHQYHNHTPHLLGSASILGASPQHLNAIYDSEASSGLVPWEDSPGEISRHDWRDYLGRREYERAFVDFFEDQMVEAGYDWKGVVAEFVLGGGGGGKEEGEAPLINNLILAGLAHPLIHLGYAYELNSREVAMEALALAATNYNPWHKYLDDGKYAQRERGGEEKEEGGKEEEEERPWQTDDLLQILDRVHKDPRLDGLFSEPGGSNLEAVFERHEAILLEYWHAYHITDPTKQFQQSQRAAVAILMSAAHPSSSQSPQPASHPPSSSSRPLKYDFYLLHLLTSTHALRILLPHLPASHHIPLLRQWTLLVLALYVAQLRPRIDIRRCILDYDRRGRGWDWALRQALHGAHALDAHFVKGVRAMWVGGETWGEKNGEGDGGEELFFLNAAVRFVEEFDGWGGFSVGEVEEQEEERRRRGGGLDVMIF